MNKPDIMKTMAIIMLWAFLTSCTEKQAPANHSDPDPNLETLNQPRSPSITPFLMFTGKAEEAIEFYISLFPGAKMEELTRWSPGESGEEGSVKLAIFSLDGQKVMCTDSPPVHDFTFTPAISLYVSCPSEEEFEKYVDALAEGGKFLMPPDDYGFSKRFAWVEDRFGVSWQLNLQ